MGVRPERVQEAIRQELSTIIHNEIRDPRVGFLTVTRVELTKDLRYAKVFFSVFGGVKDKKRALYGLNSAKGYIKGLLSDKVKLRFMPELDFRIDNSFERAQEMNSLFDKIEKESKHEDGDSGTEKQ